MTATALRGWERVGARLQGQKVTRSNRVGCARMRSRGEGRVPRPDTCRGSEPVARRSDQETTDLPGMAIRPLTWDLSPFSCARLPCLATAKWLRRSGELGAPIHRRDVPDRPLLAQAGIP